MRIGAKITTDNDWNKLQETVMLTAVITRTKFSQHNYLTKCLLDTGDATIVLINVKDNFWTSGLPMQELHGVTPGSWPGVTWRYTRVLAWKEHCRTHSNAGQKFVALIYKIYSRSTCVK